MLNKKPKKKVGRGNWKRCRRCKRYGVLDWHDANGLCAPCYV